MKGEKADLVIHNAQIHTMDDEDSRVFEAVAIKDGKIIELGAERQILNKYSATEVVDAKGRDIYPGFTDAHGHILAYAQQKLSVDLVGCASMDELIIRTEKYQQTFNKKVIVGRGWDQSQWIQSDMPTNEMLNKAFPSTPVCLTRIDGHAALVNDAMLKRSGINSTTKIDGGEVVLQNEKPTGLLIDNAIELVKKKIPEFTKTEMTNAVLEIEQELLMYGITGVHEAGINFKDIDFFKNLIDKKGFSIQLYAMLLPSDENKAFARKNGIYNYKNLVIRSFKVYGDGSLGSRGALMKQPYSDAHNHSGLLLTSLDEMKSIAKLCNDIGYQMNTHAIGDSTNKLILDLYKTAFEKNPDHRWRIEHAQVVDINDIHLFSKYNILPSVQPTHAVSDERWAEQRIGKERMKGAYAYKTLLERYGLLAIGTDFPIESCDPFATIYAATKRRNKENAPIAGFYENEGISLKDCLNGMTYWAAIASFQENHIGKLKKGYDATFAIFEKPIKEYDSYEPNFSMATYIKGKKVYSAE